jgi:3'-phosphoadenosine 5'-phosphosulfate sulfotransferase
MLGKFTFWFLILFLIGCIFLPWQQSSRCEGIVTARNPNERRQVFLSPAKGIILSQKEGLQEGTWVEEGEAIMVLDTLAGGEIQLVTQQIEQLESKREDIESQIKQGKERIKFVADYGILLIESAERDVQGARAKWDQSKSEIAAQKSNVRQAQVDFESMKTIRGATVSEVAYQESFNKLDYEQKTLIKIEQSADEAYQNLQSKQIQLDGKRKEIQDNNAKQEQELSEYQSKLAEVTKEIRKLTVDLNEFKRNEIASPNTGYVQSIISQVGKAVSNGEPLFEIIPATEDLWVELSVRGNDQPLIHVGDKVRLQFEGWPAIQFVGWPSVARGTFGGVVNAINPADDGTGNFKIFVGPDPEDVTKNDWPDKNYLKQGVRANAWVLLDEVTLGFEIWRQVNGFPLTLGEKSKEFDKKKDEVKKPKLK